MEALDVPPFFKESLIFSGLLCWRSSLSDLHREQDSEAPVHCDRIVL